MGDSANAQTGQTGIRSGWLRSIGGFPLALLASIASRLAVDYMNLHWSSKTIWTIQGFLFGAAGLWFLLVHWRNYAALRRRLAEYEKQVSSLNKELEIAKVENQGLSSEVVKITAERDGLQRRIDSGADADRRFQEEADKYHRENYGDD